MMDSSFQKVLLANDPSSSTPHAYKRRLGHVGRTYCILMTPRSGSTWLTRLVASYDVLSFPDEYFNIENFETSLRHNPARSVYEYYDNITEAVSSPAGVFGFEITPFDLQKLEEEVDLLGLMAGERCFFTLTRHDFVKQAISLYFAHASQCFHAFDERDVQRADDAVNAFRKEDIKQWIRHILQQEYLMREWLVSKSIVATPLCYEDIVKDPEGVVLAIAQRLNCKIHGDRRTPVVMTKRLESLKKQAFAKLFLTEEAEWCAHWQQWRGKLPCTTDYDPR